MRREQLRPPALRQRDGQALAAAAERLAGGRAQLDEPAVRADLRREPELEAVRRQRGGQRRRGVHDEEVTGLEEPRQVAEARVDELEVVARRDEHRDVVPTVPADLGRLVRLQPNGSLEGAHASTVSSRAA